MFPKGTINKALGLDIAVSSEMASAIDLWSKMYLNKANWLKDGITSLNLPSAVASELARLITTELKTEVTGSARADYLNIQYQNVINDLRTYTEYGCAKGGLVFKPYIDGEGIVTDCVQADGFFPTAYNSHGDVTGAVFAERLNKGRRVYTRLEHHNFNGGAYTVRNKAYVSEIDSSLGYEIPLSAVEEWAGLDSEVTIGGIQRPLFAYFKVPQANIIDPSSPLGISVYARAVDTIKQADKQWERIQWEYEGSELAIDASMDIFEPDDNGNLILPKGKERLFRAHDIDLRQADSTKFMETFSPAIRDTSLFNGFNNILKRVEYNCGLAYGTLSDPQNVDKTAEEIKASKQRSYSTVCDLQKSLQTALENLVYAMDVWTTLGNLAPKGNYEITFDWDDSIVVDAATERMQDKEDVRDGLMQPFEFRMKWYGEDEATAKKMVGAKQTDDELMGFEGDA